jgi:hypothetical protein
MKEERRFMTIIALAVAFVLIGVAGSMAAEGGNWDNTGLMVDKAQEMTFQFQLVKHDPLAEGTGPLGNTKWRVTSMNPAPEKPYASKVLTFETDGRLVETTTFAEGPAKSETSRYYTVGSTMLIQGKGKNDVNARFRVEGNTLIIDADNHGLILKKLD